MKPCLGTAQLGMDYGVRGGKWPGISGCLDILDKAIFACGVDMLDTAGAYGEAEHVIGAFFAKHPQCKKIVSVVTKVPALGNDGEAAEKLHRSLEQSLRNLQMDAVDGLLLHAEADMCNDAAMEALLEAKRQGKVRHIGVSVYEPDMALYAAEHPLMDCVQIAYNALDRRLEANGFFEMVQRNHKTVFARSVFLQGLLLMDKISVRGAEAYARKFQAIAGEYGMTPAQGCIQYVLENPDIQYMIMGVERPEELETNAQYMRGKPNMEFLRDIRKNIQCEDRYVLMPNLWSRS